MVKPSKIVLERIVSMKQLKRPKNDIETEFLVYDKRKHEFMQVFFQVNWEAKRIYVDFWPDDPNHINGIENGNDQLLELHDEEYTDYFDFDDAMELFELHELYMVKK